MVYSYRKYALVCEEAALYGFIKHLKVGKLLPF